MEANLVSRIPAPSIKARRIPPIAADPTMATGPSGNKKHKLTSLWLFHSHKDVELQYMTITTALTV